MADSGLVLPLSTGEAETSSQELGALALVLSVLVPTAALSLRALVLWFPSGGGHGSAGQRPDPVHQGCAGVAEENRAALEGRR